ncbi:MAG: diacylglycerol kinase family protein [Flavobacteriales bacterium]|nr:diacylglycerol kinase family protein [Flavobacteriales bacterium]
MIKFITARIKSFGHAFSGIAKAFHGETHIKIHMLAVVVVCAAAVWLGVSGTHWAILVLCMAAVISLEIANTALERALDRLHPERHQSIGDAKDLMAGAVLVSAMASVIIAVLIFSQYF